MAPKEPTRAQLSSRLSYSQNTPAFLRKFQNRVAGVPDEDEDDDDDEFEYDGSGRPPIPKRPAIPERPSDQAGSADEDDGDERPQVVVLKEGKHLSQKEAENERRKARGLPPLPEPSGAVPADSRETLNEAPVKARSRDSLSFSSKAGMKPSTSGKRKAVGDPGEHGSKDGGKKTKKKAKKAPRTLLSFADDE